VTWRSPKLACLQEKIRKLFDIWDRGQTFPPEMIKTFRDKLAAPPPRKCRSELTEVYRMDGHVVVSVVSFVSFVCLAV